MESRRPLAFAVVLMMVSLAMPSALVAALPSQALQVAPYSSSTSGCFGYNGVNDSLIPKTIASLRIALIEPIFTSTPYSQYATGSFYGFYAKEQGVTTNVTTNLDDLSTNVSSAYTYNDGWGHSYGMYHFFTSQTAVNCGLALGRNVRVLTDIDVGKGGLFDSQNGSARFDVVVLPFSEYVEAQEYLAYEEFVAGGGTLVIMGHSLEYPVTYNATTNFETLVYGHNWAYNGQYAYPVACGSNTYVASCPWAANNTDWVGSNTCEASCFHNYDFNGSVVNPEHPIGKALSAEFGSVVMKSYLSHEEDTITNMTGTSVVSVFVNDSRNLIAPYTHQFRKGVVVGFCIFGDDIIATDLSAQYFLLKGIAYGRVAPTPVVVTTTTVPSSTTALSTGSSTSSPAVQVSNPSPQSPGTPPWVLPAMGGVAAVAVVAGLFVVGRRRGRA